MITIRKDLEMGTRVHPYPTIKTQTNLINDDRKFLHQMFVYSCPAGSSRSMDAKSQYLVFKLKF